MHALTTLLCIFLQHGVMLADVLQFLFAEADDLSSHLFAIDCDRLTLAGEFFIKILQLRGNTCYILFEMTEISRYF